MNRLPNLDPLRFVLAALVLLFHLPQLCKNQGLPYFLEAPIFNRGIEAVYMFFVLSGFLIIRLIYNEKQRNCFSIKSFYIKRILRIFPLYYLIVFFGFTFYQLILPKLGIPFENNYNLGEGVLLTLFFLPNVFATLMPGGILEVLWSIGIEEQFYIVIAPFLLFVNKNRVLICLVILTTLYFLVFHIEYFSIFRKFSMVYFYLLFGGIIAVLEEKQKLNFLKTKNLIPFLIVIITILYFTTNIFNFEIVWLKNLTTMLLFGFFIHSIGCNNRGFVIRSKILNYLGQISYGIYIFHVLALNLVVFVFLKIRKMNLFSDEIIIILINILTFVITIIIAHFSYKYYESYFLKLKNKFRT